MKRHQKKRQKREREEKAWIQKEEPSLTCTFGPGDQWWPWRPGSSLPRSGQQDFDLILHIWVQMPQFVGGGVHHVCLGPVPWSGAVLHLLQDDWPVTDDAVGIGFDPKVGGADSQKFRWCNGGGRSCEIGTEVISYRFRSYNQRIFYWKWNQ